MKRILIISFFFTLLLLISYSDSAKPKGKKGTAKSKASEIYSGASPAGATKWFADSPSTIYTDIDVSYLNFDRIPRFLCSISTGTSHLIPEAYESNYPNVFSPEAAILMNVTGKYLPRSVSRKGFRVRLKYKPEDGRNLTVYTAKNWRVRWIAIMDDHPIMLKLYKEVGDVKPSYLTEIAYIKMLQALATEDPAFVDGIFGRDYQLPLSKIPKTKPKPANVKVEKKEDASTKEQTSPENNEEPSDSTFKDGQTKNEGEAERMAEDSTVGEDESPTNDESEMDAGTTEDQDANTENNEGDENGAASNEGGNDDADEMEQEA